MLLSEGQLPLLQNDFWFFKGVSAIQTLISYKMQFPTRFYKIYKMQGPAPFWMFYFLRKHLWYVAQGLPFCAGNWINRVSKQIGDPHVFHRAFRTWVSTKERGQYPPIRSTMGHGNIAIEWPYKTHLGIQSCVLFFAWIPPKMYQVWFGVMFWRNESARRAHVHIDIDVRKTYFHKTPWNYFYTITNCIDICFSQACSTLINHLPFGPILRSTSPAKKRFRAAWRPIFSGPAMTNPTPKVGQTAATWI